MKIAIVCELTYFLVSIGCVFVLARPAFGMDIERLGDVIVWYVGDKNCWSWWVSKSCESGKLD